MEYKLLGKTNLRVSAIGLGGIPLQKCTPDEAQIVIDTAFSSGINFIDSARGYGDSESLIGKAIKKHPDHFIIATKSPAKTEEDMKNDIHKSLEALAVDQIDLYQCHFVKSLEQYEQIISESGALKALQEAKAKGLIKHIGITAHTKEVLEHALLNDVWETIQFPYNFVETQATDLFKTAYENNVGIIVMKPLAGGAIENAKLAMKFILNNPHITTAIPGMNTQEQVLENTSIFSKDLLLSDSEKIEIETFIQSHKHNFCRRCGYCGPCPEGIDIPLMFTLEGYLTRYDLKDWAVNRYRGLEKKATHCVRCGVCEPKCPYDIAIRDRLNGVAQTFTKLI